MQYEINNQKIHYVDIGARGNLGEPWITNENKLVVYGFEADPEEHQRLQTRYPNRYYFPFALSSKSGKIKLFITKEPSQSSIYSPSKKNCEFEKIHWETRQSLKEVFVPCSTIDESLNCHIVDAIKIDTQGAEYEILNGGVELLKNQKPFLFLETWSHPVYSEMPLMHEILQMLYQLGYELWATEDAAAWRYSIPAQGLPTQGVRQRLIGLNLLLVPNLHQLKQLETERIYARINILRWYGFLDAAYLLAEHIGNLSLIQDISDQIKREASQVFRIKIKLKKIIFRQSHYPPIT